MIIARFGQSELGGFQENVHYKCGTTICYSIGGAANHEKLQNLQRAANTVATRLGLKTIVVDGFIGKDTVTLIHQIALRVAATTGALGEFRTRISKETVTAKTEELLVELQALTAPPVSTPIPPTPSPTVPTPTTTAPAVPGSSPMTPAAEQIEQQTSIQTSTQTTSVPGTSVPGTSPKKSNIGLIAAVIGGIAVVGAVVAVVAVKRSKRS